MADSLVALELPAVREAAPIADLGSGGGFPGLALAIALPGGPRRPGGERGGASARSSPARRRRLGLTNVEVVNARAEEWTAGSARTTSWPRAPWRPCRSLVEYAAPLLASGGALVAWKGRRDPAEEAAAARRGARSA